MIDATKLKPASSLSPATGTLVAPAVLAVVAYVLAMPLLAGLPRGGIIPLVRPSEVLQLLVTAVAVGLAAAALLNGKRWQFTIRPIEWWLLAVAFSASVLPLLWLVARSQPVGIDEILATFPFIKYSALYLLIRCCVTTEQAVSTVVRATLAAASVIAVIAITQALGVGPVIDVLGRFFVSGAEDLVDEGRGTTTIGSSIATGAYLSISCGIALSIGWTTGAFRWLGLAGFIAVGALASGQAGTVIALGVVVLAVAHMHGRTRQLISWGIPAAVLVTIGLWPIVSARLADFDPNRGLPGSWVIRWNNLTELYLPSLSGRGWLLGVSPDAILTPPDVWREAIYLESGYLWLLWVGGLPLLLAVAGLLITAWRSLAPNESQDPYIAAVAVAGRAAIVMIALVSIIDPHLTLRAGADLFFMLLALGMASRPIATSLRHLPSHWRTTLAADGGNATYATARLRVAEGVKQPLAGGVEPEMVLNLTVRTDGANVAAASLGLVRNASELQGVLVKPVAGAEPVAGVDQQATGLAWRALILSAESLRLTSLTDGAATFDRREIRAAAKLARHLEIERAGQQPAVYRPARAGKLTADSSEGTDSTDNSDNTADLPAVRFIVGGTIPGWKRAIDVAVGFAALIATAPLSLICAVLIRRSDTKSNTSTTNNTNTNNTSAGPILFRQVRIGTGGLPFQIYKFRTMYVDNDDAAHRAQNKLELRGEADAAKDENDPRVTPIGRHLRRLSLDELPQLLNVMRSEMSLVGPRPSLLWESELFPPATRRRMAARPGLTGLWQINGRADVSMAEMLDLDLEYMDRMSPLFDVRCLAKTATAVVAGDGAR